MRKRAVRAWRDECLAALKTINEKRMDHTEESVKMGVVLWVITRKLEETNDEEGKATLAAAQTFIAAAICENRLNETRMSFEAVDKIYEQQMRHPNMVPENLLDGLKTTRDGWAVDLAILEGNWAVFRNTRPIKDKQFQAKIVDWILENITPETKRIAMANYSLPK